MSLHRWAVPYLTFPLAERLGGRQMWTEQRRLRAAQWLPRAELERRALAQLTPLLRHAAVHVAHYRDRFGQAGVRLGDVRELADLARLPITTKAELRAGFPDRTSADNLPRWRRQPMRTSGSTGLPFEFYWDRAAHDLRFGAYLFSLEWAGVAIWDTRIAIVVPSSTIANIGVPSRPGDLARRIIFGEHRLALSADDLTAHALRALLTRVPRGRRYFIRGYPSAIAWLARQLAADPAPLDRKPQAIITYAESLTSLDAAVIRDVFQRPVLNYYTSWDVPHIAQTCPDNPKALHVSSDRVIIRVVRADGSDALPEEPGRVVATDLTNYVMPLINYDLGDHAAMGVPCPCGRGFPTLATIEGRGTELIRTPSGRQVSGIVLGNFLTFDAGVIPHVLEYQAVQTASGRVTLRVVAGRGFTPAVAVALRAKLESFLGPGMTVAVEPTDRIPLEPSGKRLIIKSLRPPEAGPS